MRYLHPPCASQVFDDPAGPRAIFEALVTDNVTNARIQARSLKFCHNIKPSRRREVPATNHDRC